MSENDSESLPFEPPEQENARLRDENARLIENKSSAQPGVLAAL